MCDVGFFMIGVDFRVRCRFFCKKPLFRNNKEARTCDRVVIFKVETAHIDTRYSFRHQIDTKSTPLKALCFS